VLFLPRVPDFARTAYEQRVLASKVDRARLRNPAVVLQDLPVSAVAG